MKKLWLVALLGVLLVAGCGTLHVKRIYIDPRDKPFIIIIQDGNGKELRRIQSSADEIDIRIRAHSDKDNIE